MTRESTKPQKRTLPVLLPKKGLLRYVIRAFYSIKNFLKASVLSILVLVVIRLLLSQMEQAYTMFLRMIEFGKPSLILCFILVFLLAMGLSHFPIYTYYAGNLNGSRKYIEWENPRKPFNWPFFNKIKIYTFTPFFHPNYVKDIYANVLRQYLGLLLFFIWIHFIFSTFEPNLKFTVNNLSTIKVLIYSFAAAPFIAYLFLKRKLNKFHSTIEERRKILRVLGKLLVVASLVSIVLLIVIAFSTSLFSQGGLLILLLTTFFMMVSFTLLRLVRPRLKHTIGYLEKNSNKYFASLLSLLKPLQPSVNYLKLFHRSFFICLLAIIYFNLASINNWILPNGLAIVLIYLYTFFFIISILGKYYFVQFSLAQKAKKEAKPLATLNSRSFKLLTGSLLVFIILFITGFFTESNINELTIYKTENAKSTKTDTAIQQKLSAASDTVFFVSSRGGGLKSNTWTLLALNRIQEKTDGKFIKQCISFSGASGGSVGLAFYGNLYGIYGNDYKKIAAKIDSIRDQNYASIDISMLFGLDAIRIAWPLNSLPNSHDRSYYGMIKYQNIIKSKESKNLDKATFKAYWNKIQETGNLLPVLIMNTAATNGQRGIFCSMETDSFNDIFPYSKNLADLNLVDGGVGSVSFYQAVSTTNRFPIFSPVAKIKGYGHFIDAGAIDNSGILGNWDLYLHLKQKEMFKNKTVVFVDIDNSKSGYAKKLLKSFLDEKQAIILKEENEKLALYANLQTGLNLDKIPGYLTDFMATYSSKQKNLEYLPISLPHKITIEDIEDAIEGTIIGDVADSLAVFLAAHNKEILQKTEPKVGFWDKWSTYEPVLSRHLSSSNNKYFDRIIADDKTGINEVLNFCK